MNDLIEPIEFLDKGYCPICRKPALKYVEHSRMDIYLDKHGQPIDFEDQVLELTGIVCTSCNFVGTVGKDYITLEDGSFKFVTEAGLIHEVERIKGLLPKRITHLHADSNPFMKEK